jgi:hypothetical protein
MSPDRAQAISLPPPLTIGLSPVADPGRWLAPDDSLLRHLHEKERLIAAVPGEVFRAEDDTGDVQNEVAVLLSRHLCEAFPETYRETADGIAITGRQRAIRVDPDSPRLLEQAALLVADDLVVMRRKPEGWTLVAASLCFPTFWRLSEKFGHPLDVIHAPVPGFAAGTRNATLIARIFDNLRPGMPVQRSNWSIHGDGELHHREPHGEQFGKGGIADVANLFLRREKQSLTRLAETGDILFTIRIALDPLSGLERYGLERYPERCETLAARLTELDTDGLRYKGLGGARDNIVGWLRERAASRTSKRANGA